MATTGSEPDHQSSHPMLQDSCRVLGIPVDEARGLLMSRGIYAQLHDRIPFVVVKTTLEEVGYTPQPLRRVG